MATFSVDNFDDSEEKRLYGLWIISKSNKNSTGTGNCLRGKYPAGQFEELELQVLTLYYSRK